MPKKRKLTLVVPVARRALTFRTNFRPPLLSLYIERDRGRERERERDGGGGGGGREREREGGISASPPLAPTILSSSATCQVMCYYQIL